MSYLVAYNLGTGLAAGGRQLLAFNVLNYLWPMTTLLFSAAFSRSRVRWWIAPGLAAGLAGTVLALWSQQADPGGAAAVGSARPSSPAAATSPSTGSACTAASRGACTRPSAVGSSGSRPRTPCRCCSSPPRPCTPSCSRWGSGRGREPPDLRRRPSAAGIAAFLWRALVVDLLSYAFWDAAMRRGNQVLAAAASFLTPILSSACIALALGVSPGWRFWLAALLAVGGAAVCRMSVREGASFELLKRRVVPESRRGV